MINKIFNKLNYLVKKYVFFDKFLWSLDRWNKDKGDLTLRLDYDLNPESVIFDVGGYNGDFSYEILKRYDCNIHIFEPVSRFNTNLSKRFLSHDKIKVHPIGLSNLNEEILINIEDNASSIFTKSKKNINEKITLKSIIDFCNDHKIDKIDLMKLNIEGGEFDLILSLINSDYIKNIKNLQVQFHDFVPNAKNKRNLLRDKLKITHKLTYDYYFVWENWVLK